MSNYELFMPNYENILALKNVSATILEAKKEGKIFLIFPLRFTSVDSIR